MNAIVLTGASTSMARPRDRGYRDHRHPRINLKFNPASIAGEEGMRRRCVGQSGLPHPGGEVGEEAGRDEALSLRREGERCRLTS